MSSVSEAIFQTFDKLVKIDYTIDMEQGNDTNELVLLSTVFSEVNQSRSMSRATFYRYLEDLDIIPTRLGKGIRVYITTDQAQLIKLHLAKPYAERVYLRYQKKELQRVS